MPKGYIIVRGTVTDLDAFAAYGPLAAEAMRKHGVKVLVRNGRSQAVEGEGRPRNIVMEAESYEAALAYYFSPEYQAAAAVRKLASLGEIIIVEGVD